MEVVLDGQKGFLFQQEPQNVLTAVSAVNDALRTQGRAILALAVDGRPVGPGDALGELASVPLEQVGTLSITSEAVNTLVRSCLVELEQALPELPQVCHSLAEIFQGQNPETGYEPFEQLAIIWKTIKERELQVFSALDIDLSAIDVNGEPIARMHEELNQYIQEAADALKAKDCVLLGDLLEYELAPRAETEAAIVALLRAKVAP